VPVRPAVSVVIAAFADERWDDLVEAVRSVCAQTHPPLEVVVVVDHNRGLLARARAGLTDTRVRVVPSAGAPGASGARNTGLATARGEVLAFLDDDAVATPEWLERLVGHFDDPSVLGVGGRLDALWAGRRPAWFPRQFDWVVGGSYLGMPTTATAVRNVWTGSMAVRREVLEGVGGFRDGFGRIGARVSSEDTDLCLRVARARPDGRWVFDPEAVAGHKVPASRATVGFFLRRCYREGRGKADLCTLDGTGPATRTERTYAATVLPRGVLAGLAESARGDPGGLVRSAAITVGLLSTVCGFAVGRAAPRIAVPTPGGRTGPPRVLVDQSGYDLLNLGDVAMLQACVRRLSRIWPDAEVAVLCHDPGLLAEHCPDALPVRLTRREPPGSRTLRRLYLGSAQAWKILGPYVVRPGRPGSADRSPHTWREGLAWADVVVASGGGYLADTWWWHGAGVLSVLAAAQRSGRPTAMFGQGLGPLTHRPTRRQARSVLPRLDVLGLRGGAGGEPLARSLGVARRVLTVTGDDALELVDPAAPCPEPLIGVNLRVTPYAGVTDGAAAAVGATLRACARRRGAGLLGLPVSLAPGADDADALRRSLDVPGAASGLVVPEVRSPADLAAAAARCRVVVTGSYHAAVFALARGVPTVALSGSAYYDAKLGDLRALFPQLTWVVPVGRADTTELLTAAVDAAWDVEEAVRADGRTRARHQRWLGRDLYVRFTRRCRPVPDRPVPDEPVPGGLLRVPA